MTVSEGKAIATAVAKALNAAKDAGTLAIQSDDATAQEQVPEIKKEAIGLGKLTVVPVARRSVREARDFWRYEHDVDVALIHNIEVGLPNREEQIEESHKQAELLDEWFADTANEQLTLVDAVSGATTAEFISSVLNFLASEQLENLNVAMSVTRLTFHVWRT